MSNFINAIPLPGSKNVAMTVNEGVLKLWIDLNKDFGESSTGKSIVIASSCGNKPLGLSNAFIGLNLYVKSLDLRDLSSKGIDSLSSTVEFYDLNECCQWRIEKINVNESKEKSDNNNHAGDNSGKEHAILCIQIDFTQIKGRTASSGKSILLATSGGNKPVGNTKIMCGFNCYRPINSPLNYNKIIVTDDVNDNENCTSNANTIIKVGESINATNGFTLNYVETDNVIITFTLPEHFINRASNAQVYKNVAEKIGANLRNIILANNVNVSLFVNPVKPKRSRIKTNEDKGESNNDDNYNNDKNKKSKQEREEGESSKNENGENVINNVIGIVEKEDGKDSSKHQISSNGGGFAEYASTKVRNVTVSCEAVTDTNDFVLTVQFNPTIEFGRSTSDKSIIVATTGGFQLVNSADGQARCVVSFNAYKPAEKLTSNAINDAVHKALASVSTNELHSVSFKSILEKVESMLQLDAKHEVLIKDRVKEAIRSTLKETAEKK